MKPCHFLKIRIKTKKNTLCIRIQSITMTKNIVEFNTQEKGIKRWKSIVQVN